MRCRVRVKRETDGKVVLKFLMVVCACRADVYRVKVWKKLRQTLFTWLNRVKNACRAPSLELMAVKKSCSNKEQWGIIFFLVLIAV